MDHCLFMIFIFLSFTTSSSSAIKWLALNKVSTLEQGAVDDRTIRTLPGLDHRQKKLLLTDPALLSLMKKAANSVISTCEASFNESRWNCSSLRHLPEMSPELQSGTREQAYVYALSSAILTLQLSRACNTGDLRGCSCNRNQKRNSYPPSFQMTDSQKSDQSFYTWKGCTTHIKHSLKFSERFTDSGLKKYKNTETDTNFQRNHVIKNAVINLHNLYMGRQIAKHAVKTQCKCHGISGSCELKTCWTEIDLKQVLSDLKEKYGTAVEMSKGDTLAEDSSKKSGHGKRELKSDQEKLLFYSISSDYCNPDLKKGSLGTMSRKCGDSTKNNCQWMCCGRGYTVREITTEERCNCQHVWCCYVKCDTCKITRSEFYCK